MGLVKINKASQTHGRTPRPAAIAHQPFFNNFTWIAIYKIDTFMTLDEVLKVIQDNTQGPRHWPDIKAAVEAYSSASNNGKPVLSGSLPLDDLEKRLDEALAKETPETLKKWLKEKRQ